MVVHLHIRMDRHLPVNTVQIQRLLLEFFLSQLISDEFQMESEILLGNRSTMNYAMTLIISNVVRDFFTSLNNIDFEFEL